MPAPTDHPHASSGWWHCVALGDDGRPTRFTVVWSDDHPDEAHVELPERAATAAVGDKAFCVAELDARGAATSLSVSSLAAPKAPPLWFAELPEDDATPPTIVLIAFTGHGVEPGRLLDQSALADTDVVSSDQVGAVRWYPATGEVDQVYVQPAWRRRTVASALMAAGGTLSELRGWPRWWGDGQRTALGDRWTTAAPWSHRTADLTHLAPPMTPFDQR